MMPENCKVNDCQQRLLRAEIDRLTKVLESLTEDPPPTLDEPDADWEVIVKMRAIARAALSHPNRGDGA